MCLGSSVCLELWNSQPDPELTFDLEIWLLDTSMRMILRHFWWRSPELSLWSTSLEILLPPTCLLGTCLLLSPLQLLMPESCLLVTHIWFTLYIQFMATSVLHMSVFPISVAVTLNQAVIISQLDSCSGFLNVLPTPFFVSSLILLHTTGSDLSKMKADLCLMKAFHWFPN